MNVTKMLHSLKVGKRMLKTALTVFLCFLIYELRGRAVSPFYSTAAAVLCMQANSEDSIQTSINRIYGTLVGAFFGSLIVVFEISGYFPKGIWGYAIMSLAIIPIIKTCVELKKPETASFSCMVFLCVVEYQMTNATGASAFLYVFNRIVDTLIGIVLALVINNLHLPRKHREDILFVSALDKTLTHNNGRISSYSIVELNAMLEEGLNFTVATELTPAALIDALKGVRLELPVIAMNGCALYDMKNNHFLMEVTIPHDLAMEIVGILDSLSIGSFVNSILHDVLLIYIQDIKSMELQSLYRDLRVSPYRNFIYGPLPEGQDAAYIYTLDKTELIEKAVRHLKAQPFAGKLRIVTGEEPGHPDCLYLKIYNCKADIESMIWKLAHVLSFDKVISLGSDQDIYDIYIPEAEENKAVRTIKSLYKPYIWEQDDPPAAP